MSNQLHTSKIRSSLIRPLGWMGGERLLVLFALLLSIYFAFIYSLTVGLWQAAVVSLSIWGISMAVLTRMGKHDMQMLKVYWRHRKYKTFYPAKGRLNSPVREMGPFSGK
ncbi:conjugal transfer protein (plasmid) [Methylovorus glucosotrophus SIP3-4]|uniref:Conjugal transfer protein n=2 Tax=Methylovorus glucosotrophus TaxID=266009 RepID=C6XES3_METGS|nr:conjugal transfer protein [Methylovorus glucosotrophus SIP3-4]